MHLEVFERRKFRLVHGASSVVARIESRGLGPQCRRCYGEDGDRTLWSDRLDRANRQNLGIGILGLPTIRNESPETVSVFIPDWTSL
jgi:hypothetical protein